MVDGNSGRSVRRVGDTVHRQATDTSATVERLLAHLERAGFDAAPAFVERADGADVLTWLDGPVAHTDLPPLSSSEVRAIGAMARRLHDATTSFARRLDDAWSPLARDPDPDASVICHNDLATWNLVLTGSGWALIDWDLAAPGRRVWDLAWTLCSLVGPDDPRADAEGSVAEIVGALLEGYGTDAAGQDEVLAVAVERATREAARLRGLSREGDGHAARLVEAGHAAAWEATRSRLDRGR